MGLFNKTTREGVPDHLDRTIVNERPRSDPAGKLARADVRRALIGGPGGVSDLRQG
jgi:hypothetical protein